MTSFSGRLPSVSTTSFSYHCLTLVIEKKIPLLGQRCAAHGFKKSIWWMLLL